MPLIITDGFHIFVDKFYKQVNYQHMSFHPYSVKNYKLSIDFTRFLRIMTINNTRFFCNV